MAYDYEIIVWAAPLFIVLMALEYGWGQRVGKQTYRLSDAMTSINLGVLSQVSGVLSKTVGLAAFAAWAPLVALPFAHALNGFWHTAWGYALALVLYDFCYYWLHRLGHTRRILWAAHNVHHQSQDYNLSTALRQTSSGFLLSWVFYLPMAAVGVPFDVLFTVAAIDLIYQFWVHTEHVPRLGWLDRWLATPSNHRVHHAINDAYLDKNFGGITMVWDRLFGTYQVELALDPCVYGTKKPLNSWNPLWANVVEYVAMARDSAAAWRHRAYAQAVWVWLGATDYRTSHAAPQPLADAATPMRFEPSWRKRGQAWALVGFVVVAVFNMLALDGSADKPAWQQWLWLALVTAGCWATAANYRATLAPAAPLTPTSTSTPATQADVAHSSSGVAE
jgi:alkylglycerol monooxygenase